MFPLLVRQPTYLSIWPSAPSFQRGLSTNQRRQCGAYVGPVEEIVCVMCVGVAEGHSGAVCYLVSTLCKYDLRKGYLYVLSWGRVRRLRREVCVRV